MLWFPNRQKLECIVQAMYLIEKGYFPCLPMIMWAYMKKFDFDEHKPEGEDVFVDGVRWPVPKFSLSDFYSVPTEFITAAYKFLECFPETRQSVLSMRSKSAPTTQALSMRMPPDTLAVNMVKLREFLSAGRCSLYQKLDTWDDIGLVTPVWKDTDFFKHEVKIVEDDLNRVQTASQAHHTHASTW